MATVKDKLVIVAAACFALAFPVWPVVLWYDGFHEYAIAVLCLHGTALVCAAIGFRRDRHRKALYGLDSTEWNELERRGREFGTLCGKFAVWPPILVLSMIVLGFSPKTVILAGTVALGAMMAILFLAARR